MGKPLGNPGNGGGGNGKGGGKEIIHTGTDGSDTMICGDESETVFALGGDDIINSGGGNDTLDGGEGSDTYIVDGFGGIDWYDDTGAEGWDLVEAGSKGTVIYVSNFDENCGIEEISAGGHAAVNVSGTSGSDHLDFSGTVLTGIQYIKGQGGNDYIVGSDADDVILAGSGNDTVNGGEGQDTLVLGSGSDTILVTDILDAGDTVVDFNPDEDFVDLSNLASDSEIANYTLDETDAGTALMVELSNGDVRELMTFMDDGNEHELGIEDALLF